MEKIFPRAVTLAAALAGLLAAPAAQAQAGRRVFTIPPGREAPAPDYQEPPRPYVQSVPRGRGGLLTELAGTMGAIHYLAVACDGRQNQYWRERMIAVLETETGGDRYLRGAMVDAFNDQYRERERRFPQCSPEARADRQEAALRGQTLAEQLAEPYR